MVKKSQTIKKEKSVKKTPVKKVIAKKNKKTEIEIIKKEEFNIKNLESIKPKIETIKEGDYLSDITYYSIIAKQDNMYKVKDQNGDIIYISKNIIENEYYTSDQYEEIIELNQTQLVELFTNARRGVLTVNFNKKQTNENVTNILQSLSKEEFLNEKIKKKICKRILEGEEVTLVGYISYSDNNTGRSLFHDLKLNKKNDYKYIDHRTINYIIYQGVKYTK